MSPQSPNHFLMTRLPWIIAALAVLALVATLLWQRGTPAAAGNAELQALQARLAALETGQPAGTAPGFPASSGMPRARPSPLQPGGALERLGERSRRTPEQLAADRERELQALEAQFARDAADPVKGNQVERSLEQTVSGETMASTGIKPDEVAIDCKRNGCRVVADFAKAGDAQDWAMFYLTAAAPNLSSARVVQIPRPDGSNEVRIYGVRSGK